MSISPVSCSSCSSDSSIYQKKPGAPMKDLMALQNALKSGNLADAQSAFATFQSDLQTRSDAGVGNSQLSQNSQIADDIASLKNALDSSDVTTAQQAFMTLKQDLRMLKHQQTQEGPDVKTMPPVADGTTGTSPQSTDSILNVLA
jgi:HPt (histidine-containing phosphotransfer) domain-containing protein